MADFADSIHGEVLDADWSALLNAACCGWLSGPKIVCGTNLQASSG